MNPNNFYIGQRFRLAGIQYEITEIKDEPEGRFYFISEPDGNGFYVCPEWLQLYMNQGRMWYA